ncbi:MAG: hypothetical protein K1X66_02380 [Verrucomicrobiae bacterium]|nr:hypothetical protein [Verrucomicrobiae bacterium]
MLDYVSDDLSKKEVSDFHNAILKKCTDLVRLSRNHMCRYYNTWEARDCAYRGERVPDKEDKKAADRGEPTKMVVPMVYAQVQTFVAFMLSLYNQKRYLFELTGFGPDDDRAAKIGEALLSRDLNYNLFFAKLYQFLLDLSKYGVAVFKHYWDKETQTTYKKVTEPGIGLLGLQITKDKETLKKVEGTRYLGNKILNISPFHFFPDPRLPLTRFKEGEFVASEDEFSRTYLHQKEKDGFYKGVKYIPEFQANDADQSFYRNSFQKNINTGLSQAPQKQNIILTEVQLDLIPSEFNVNGKPLGEENYPVRYLVVYANGSRVIRCEPLEYMHGEFTYEVAQFSPDQHNLVNECITEMITHLQDVVTWFYNSHITNVRKSIQNQFLIDPSGIEMEDVKNRKHYIRLKPAARGIGVENFIKQLEVRDVTGRHIQDASQLQGLSQFVTGINENMLGQFSGGRRSAQEARAVNSSAANRMKMIARLIYDTCLMPLARNMLSNLRDGLDEKTYVRIFRGIAGVPTPNLQEYNRFVPVDKADLIGNFDFEIFDGTLPSEKSSTAETMSELLQAVISNPESASMLGFDPKKLLIEIAELKNIRYPENFMIPTTPESVLNQPGILDALTQIPPDQLIQIIQNYGQNRAGQTPAPVGQPIGGTQPEGAPQLLEGLIT